MARNKKRRCSKGLYENYWGGGGGLNMMFNFLKALSSIINIYPIYPWLKVKLQHPSHKNAQRI